MSANLKTILYVEDDPDIQFVAEIALAQVGGFDLKVCSSGHEAISAAANMKPDLILLDVMMPEMDGPTTLGELRKLDNTRNTPVIFMTAKVQAAEVSSYLALGAIAVINKPFDPMSLAETVRKHWEQVA
ncbi:response regulator [Massilia sp. W12]|uniref:response regulator n=1 Tax=Massilia sp. W12 TaxID=3126507 RepID=UPI0030D611AB